MKASFALLAPLASALIALPATAAGQQTFDWHGAVGSAATADVSVLNGSISVTRSGDAEARVHATLSGRDAPETKIHVAVHDGTLYVCPVYPGRPLRDDCSDLHDNHDRNDVKVNFDVRLPGGTKLRARAVNGAVTARGLDGSVDVATVNGNVRIDTGGKAQAKTVNGTIEASSGARRWDGDLRFESVNGGVSLTLPRDAAFTLQAGTLTGDIAITGYPLHADKGWIVGRKASGTVGSGGGTLIMRAVNGTIALGAR